MHAVEQSYTEAVGAGVEGGGADAVVGGDADEVDVGDPVLAQELGQLPTVVGDPLERAVRRLAGSWKCPPLVLSGSCQSRLATTTT
jgi:hypothetical protein